MTFFFRAPHRVGYLFLFIYLFIKQRYTNNDTINRQNRTVINLASNTIAPSMTSVHSIDLIMYETAQITDKI